MDVELAKRVLDEVRVRGRVQLSSLAEALNINIDKLRGLVEDLKKRGALKVYSLVRKIVFPGPRLLKYRDLPELIVFRVLSEYGRMRFSELGEVARQVSRDDLNAAIGRLVSKGIARIYSTNGDRVIELVDEKHKYVERASKLVELLIRNIEGISYDGLDPSLHELVNEFTKRPGIVDVKEIRESYIEPGVELDAVYKELGEEISSLTPEIIVSGVWKGREFKKYDLNERVYIAFPAKLHPMHELIKEIREIFLSMGFTEATGPLVELAFINFDMLFQPQDHPARDMQDTFYLKRPKYGVIEYPDDLVERIRLTHEAGWETGSRGWGGHWDVNEARKLLLRTHTTSVSVRKVYELGEREAKIFSIGRVFRNETVDYKHLAEFMQVDGIVISRRGNVRELMGIISEFYRRLGFEDVRFWPSYFPYTEPSLQPSIYVKKWGKWLELGGAGIFRPEVTYPLGVKWPVLAWGLGIERILMIKYDLDDIRTIYENNLGWLRHIPIYTR